MSKRKTQLHKRPRLDYERLIREAGGATKLAEILGKLGLRVEVKTVAKWGERGRASSDAVLMLLFLTRNTKPRTDLTDYLLI